MLDVILFRRQLLWMASSLYVLDSWNPMATLSMVLQPLPLVMRRRRLEIVLCYWTYADVHDSNDAVQRRDGTENWQQSILCGVPMVASTKRLSKVVAVGGRKR